MTNPINDTGTLGLAKRLYPSTTTGVNNGRTPNSASGNSEISNSAFVDRDGNPFYSVPDNLAAPEQVSANKANGDTATGNNEPVQLRQINIEKSKFDPSRALTNPLDDFINVTYNFTLALVGHDKAKELQTSALSGTNLNDILTPDDVIIFASTGDTETNSPTGINYFNIKSVEFTNLMAATPQNPMLTPMYDIRINLFEPHGFRFNEHVRSMGRKLGWGSIQPGRYVYRLQLWFSGFDPATGRWASRIPVNQISGQSFDTFTVFLSIPNIEANISPSGSEYSISAVPFGQFALRHSDYTLDATTITTTQSRTFGDFLKSLASELERQKHESSNNRLTHEYEFICPPYLAAEQFKADTQSNFMRKRNQNADSEYYITVSSTIGIFQFLRDALRDIEAVQLGMVQGPSNNSFLKPSIRYSLRVNTIFIEASDELGDYKKVRFQFIIEPHISFYRGHFPLEGRNDLVKLENQIQRANKMISLGMLQKVYDFYFSGGNSEVLNFDIKFNRFFGEAIDPVSDNLSTRGFATKETANETLNRLSREDNGVVLSIQNDEPDTTPAANLTSIIGSPSMSRAGTETFTATDILGSHAEVTPRTTPMSATATEDEVRRRLYDQANDLYTRYEMLRADIQVRGDPIWMFNPYMAEGDFSPSIIGGTYSTRGESNTVLKAMIDRCLFLKAYSPTQSDYVNPQRQYGSSEPTLIGGFYMVIKAKSKFESGKYTQTLECAKHVHMNYVVDALKQFNALTPATSSSPAPTANTSASISDINNEEGNPRTIFG